MSEIQSRIPKLHWSLKYGNTFAKRIEKGMLLPGGVEEVLKCKDRSTHRADAPSYYRVNYDVTYVEEKIIKEIFEPLNCEKWEPIEQILKDAWTTYAVKLGNAHEKI